MKLDLKTIPAKIQPYLQQMLKYLSIGFVVFFVGIYSFLLFRIDTLTASKPSEDEVSEKLKTVQTPRIDQNAVDKIEQLEDQNIQVQTLFKDARQNPFNE